MKKLTGSRRLEMAREAFTESYLVRSEPGDDNPWITRTTPCPFLKDNRCGVYEERPVDCSSYPYLYEPEFSSRTMGMIERASTCPIVFEVMEELKRETGFLRK